MPLFFPPGRDPEAPHQLASDPRVPTPINQERLAALFKAEGWLYFIDSEGDLGGQWSDATFYFFFSGEQKETLAVRSQYPGTVDSAYVETVRNALEASHRQRPWPMAWYRIDDDGRLRIHTLFAVCCEYGATDAQFLQHVRTAISASLSFFESVNKALGR